MDTETPNSVNETAHENITAENNNTNEKVKLETLVANSNYKFFNPNKTADKLVCFLHGQKFRIPSLIIENQKISEDSKFLAFGYDSANKRIGLKFYEEKPKEIPCIFKLDKYKTKNDTGLEFKYAKIFEHFKIASKLGDRYPLFTEENTNANFLDIELDLKNTISRPSRRAKK